MWHVQEREEVHKGIWWENLEIRDHLKDAGAHRKIILKWFFRK
jgi:hypothetical protein